MKNLPRLTAPPPPPPNIGGGRQKTGGRKREKRKKRRKFPQAEFPFESHHSSSHAVQSAHVLI